VTAVSSAETPYKQSASSLASRLWQGAIVSLTLLPVGMAIAHRSSPVFLGFAALFCMAATCAEGGVGAVLERMARAFRSPIGIAVLAALAWCVLSLLWSDTPVLTIRMLREFWLSVFAGFIVLLMLPSHLGRGAYLGLAFGIAVASLIILTDLSSGLAVRAAIGVRSANFIHNRPALTALLSLVPLLTFAVLCPRASTRVVVGIGVLGVLGVLAMSESGAARLGAIVALTVVIAARVSLRASAGILALILASAILLAPLTGRIAEAVIPPRIHEALASSNSRARVDIWNSFGAAVAAEPWLGAGFGTSARMGELPVATEVAPENRLLLSASHAHNAALQIWAELGLPGALAALAIVLLLLCRIVGGNGVVPVAELAFLAIVASVSLIGHGAWQGWWASSVAASLVWLRGVSRWEQGTVR
jgi:O-antigen ligase